MKQIYDILCKIGDFFIGLYDVVKEIVISVWEVLKMLPGAASTLKDAITALPDFVVVFAVATVTVSVIYMIVGRGGTD